MIYPFSSPRSLVGPAMPMAPQQPGLQQPGFGSPALGANGQQGMFPQPMGGGAMPSISFGGHNPVDPMPPSLYDPGHYGYDPRQPAGGGSQTSFPLGQRPSPPHTIYHPINDIQIGDPHSPGHQVDLGDLNGPPDPHTPGHPIGGGPPPNPYDPHNPVHPIGIPGPVGDPRVPRHPIDDGSLIGPVGPPHTPGHGDVTFPNQPGRGPRPQQQSGVLHGGSGGWGGNYNLPASFRGFFQ